MINWITPQGVLVEEFEGTEINVNISVDNEQTIMKKMSGDYPNDLVISYENNNNINIKGILPIVNEDKHYYFTIEAEDILTGEKSQRFFDIFVKNRKTLWKTEESSYTVIESTYFNVQLELLNPIGNEEFIKISGEMPSDLQINSNGLIYGVLDEIAKEKTYKFTIGVRRNNEFILTKQFQMTVKKLSSTTEPIWITESGNIGTINYLEDSNLFVSAYEPQGNPISYRIGKENNLPYGLSLNSSNGKIIGECLTTVELDWTFSVIASNGKFEVEREFSLTTNALKDEEKIAWDSDSKLKTANVGYDYYDIVKAISGLKVIYEIIGGALPNGLELTNDGLIQGVPEFQDYKEYKFTVKAYNDRTFIQKEFIITLEKGLGKNAVKSYLYINNEYLTDYQNMRELFNSEDAYQPKLKKYQVSSKPKIDVCQCSTFDKILMRYMVEVFNTPITYNWENTVKKDYQEDNSTIYSAYYKQIRELYSNSSMVNYPLHPYTRQYVDKDISYLYKGTNISVTPIGEVYKEVVIIDEESLKTQNLYYFIDEKNDKIYVDKIVAYYEEGTHKLITPTSEVWEQKIYGKEYTIIDDEKIYIRYLTDEDYYIENTKEVVSNEPIYIREYIEDDEKIQEKYIIRNGQEYIVQFANNLMIANADTNIILPYTSDTVEILREEDNVRYYYDTSAKGTVFLGSTNYLREALNQKIYVDKLEKESVYYKVGNQQIIDDDFTSKKFMVCWDEKRKTYYVRYDGVVKTFWIYSREKNKLNAELEPVYASFLSDRIYDCGDAFNLQETEFDGGNAYTNKFDFILDGNSEGYEFKPLQMIETWADLDVDYHYYIVYEKGTFNEQENILFTLEWDKSKQFVIMNGAFYIVDTIDNPYVYRPELNESFGYNETIVLPYVSDDDILEEDDKKYIQFFDKEKEILSEWKSEYYPTLDLFYSKPNTNIVALNSINDRERKGGYWVGRKFIFYELHFEPIFNKDIDIFTIDFYNHSNENSPEFQLI